jgi:hypothetical protein
MEMATAILAPKPAAPIRGTLPQHLWTRLVRHDVDKTHRRVKTLRRMASLPARNPEGAIPDTSPHIALWQELYTPVPLRTDLSPPSRDLASLGLLHPDNLVTIEDTTPSKIKACFKGPRRVTRLLIRHVRNLRRVRYGKALLNLFVKKSSVTLEYILRTAEGVTDTTFLPADLSVICDETTGRLITAPDEVVAKISQMETAALSPDPTPLRGLPSHGSGTHARRQHLRYR